MKVYIAGPMTGYPAYNFPAFYAAEEAFRCEGCNPPDGEELLVCNPARHDAEVADITVLSPEEQGNYLLSHPEAFTLKEAQEYDLKFIQHEGDAICLLPGWEVSTGARAEAHLALWLGHRVFLYAPDAEHESGSQLHELTHEQAKVILMGVDAGRKPDSYEVSVSGNQGTELTVVGEPYSLTADQIEESERIMYGSGEVRTTSSTGGQKGVKLARFDLIPAGPLRELAEHYGRGANKYANHQWRQGYEWSKSIAAKARHDNAFLGGEDYDVCPPSGEGCSSVDQYGTPYESVPSEHGPTCYNHTGSHHMAASAWHAFLLLEFNRTHPEHDDRYKVVTRPDTADRNEAIGSKSVDVRMAVVKAEPGGATCSCGWAAIHRRAKVVEEKIQRHLDKRHGGQGMWL